MEDAEKEPAPFEEAKKPARPAYPPCGRGLKRHVLSEEEKGSKPALRISDTPVIEESRSECRVHEACEVAGGGPIKEDEDGGPALVGTAA